MGNGAKAQVEAIGTFRLVLDSSFYLDFDEILCVPSVSRNLVSL